MSVDKEALARRAVQCKGWRWMPGMLTLPFRDEYGEESHPPWRVKDHGIRWPWSSAARDALPDLDDPATLGCIEHGMLPAAWGPEVILSVRRWTTESGEVLADIHVHTLTGACAMLFGVVDAPLAEALVLCLEAAAERRES